MRESQGDGIVPVSSSSSSIFHHRTRVRTHTHIHTHTAILMRLSLSSGLCRLFENEYNLLLPLDTLFPGLQSPRCYSLLVP